MKNLYKKTLIVFVLMSFFTWTQKAEPTELSYEKEIIKEQNKGHLDISINTDNSMIRSVFSNSPAETAGFQKGDIILEIEGEKVSGASIIDKISSYSAGTLITVKIMRNRREMEIPVNLTESPRGLALCMYFVKLYYQERYSDVINAIKESLNKSPEHLSCHYEKLIDSYYGLKQYKDAMKSFSELIKLDHQYDDKSMADMYFRLGYAYNEIANKKNKMKRLPVLGLLQSSPEKEYEIAIAHLQRAIDFNPELIGAYLSLGHAYDHKKKGAEAISNLIKAEKLIIKQGNEPALLAKVRKDLRSLYKEYDFIPEDFAHVKIPGRSSDGESGQSTPSEPLELSYEKEIIKEQKKGKLRELALADYFENLYTQGKYHEVIVAVKEWLEKDRASRSSKYLGWNLYTLGLSYMGLKLYKDAIKTFNEIIEIRGDVGTKSMADVYFELGNAWAHVGISLRSKDKEKELRKALLWFNKTISSLEPEDDKYAAAYYFLGLINEDLNKPTAAITNMIKAEKSFRRQRNTEKILMVRERLRKLYEKYGYTPEDFKDVEIPGNLTPEKVTQPTPEESKLNILPPTPPSAETPILEIDTGGHTYFITSISFTPDGQHLISTAPDNTVRIWNVKTGKMMRALRGQSGPGFSLTTSALSPDGRMLAVAVSIVFNKASLPIGVIRLFNLQTGEIVRIFKGHSSTIFALAFSPDGSTLISGSVDKTARIWDVRSGKVLHVLQGYTHKVVSLAISPDGSRLVTGSLGVDQTLKLWDINTGSLIANLKGHKEDHMVNSVVFTPDGQYLLSGSYDKTIRLWDAKNGRFIKILAKLDGFVEGLSIFPDGEKVLVAANKHAELRLDVLDLHSGQTLSSLNYECAGFFDNVDISPDGNTVASSGGVGCSAIHIWDINNGQVVSKKIGKDSGKSLRSVAFSKDGRSIAWGNRYIFEFSREFGFNPLEQSFNLKDQHGNFNLSLGEKLRIGKQMQKDFGYMRTIKSAGIYSIQLIYKGTLTPRPDFLQILKNDRVSHKIKLDEFRFSSNTLTPEGRILIIAGSGITSYDTETGRKLHDFTPFLWSSNEIAVSPDGRWLISGYHHTIRLWDIKRGELLLSIFHDSSNEWVAWTPEGFFDASPEGKKLIGYRINHGEGKKADYVGVDQMYDQFYRPDLVAKKLEGGYEEEIKAELRKFNVNMILAGGVPPLVEFISPRAEENINNRNIRLKIKLTDKGGGIGRVVYRLNGVTIGAEEGGRDLSLEQRHRNRSRIIEKLITLQPGDNIIAVTACNGKNEIESRASVIKLHLKDAISEKPSLYVLSIGINDYRDHSLKLSYSVSDAKALAEEMRIRGKSLFKSVNVSTVFDKEATTDGIENAFKKVSKEIKSSDLFVFYVAAHGITLDGKYHFIPSEFVYRNESSVRNESITQERLQNLLATIPALKSVILLDTCNSGSFTKLAARGIAEKTAMDKLIRATGRATIAASSDTQAALEGYKGHGVFTYVLLQALQGEADKNGNSNSETSINELAEYVGSEVPKITLKKWGYEQFPQQDLQGRSFPIGIVD